MLLLDTDYLSAREPCSAK